MSATGRARRGKQDPATATLFGEPEPARKAKGAKSDSALAPAKDTGEEFYPTPRDAILALLESDLVQLPGGNWIEPCAGTGRIISTVNEYRADVRWHAFEIDPKVGVHLEAAVRPGLDVVAPFGDFVHRPWPWPEAAALVMNPPFSLALDFVRAALDRARVVLMLQRQGWFGTQERSPWLRAHCPDMFTLPKRPSFTPDGGTDSAEYAWFHWPAGGHARREGRVAVLAPPRGGQRDLFNP